MLIVLIRFITWAQIAALSSSSMCTLLCSSSLIVLGAAFFFYFYVSFHEYLCWLSFIVCDMFSVFA